MKNTWVLFVCCLVFCLSPFMNAQKSRMQSLTEVTVHTEAVTPQDNNISISFKASPRDFYYYDYFSVSTDHPSVTLSPWKTSVAPISKYDQTFRETKRVITKPFDLTFSVHSTQTEPHDAYLLVSYFPRSQKKVTHERFMITLGTPSVSQTSPIGNAQEIPITPSNVSTSSCPAPSSTSFSPADYFSTLLKKTDSLLIRLLLCFILGILLSMTPCIYPMIPITIGILHAQKSRSFVHSFLIALAYTFGIATTFALLGLGAAFTGQLFGSVMTQPIVIFSIVALLMYLGLSMMGLYEMYIPRFLQPRQINIRGGSMLSAFLFGAASGTVASPCLSPGLVLLLSLVTTMKSSLVGFALLFSFGTGLGLPLLVIGTFSQTLQLLPRAGMWMVEIKRLFGLMMIGMCFYFLKNIIAPEYLRWLATVFCIVAGLYELNMSKHVVGMWRIIHQALGIILIATSIVFIFAWPRLQRDETSSLTWSTDYREAVERAQSSKKLVFAYLTAPYCTLCSAIEKRLLKHPAVCGAMNGFERVKIDISDEKNPVITALRTKYNVVGVPTYLIIDPVSEQQLKRWSSELYDTDPEQFAQELNNVRTMSH